MQALLDLLQPSDDRLQNASGAVVNGQLSSSIAGVVGMPLSGPDPSVALKSPAVSAAKQLRPSEGSNKIPPPGIGGGTAQVRRKYRLSHSGQDGAPSTTGSGIRASGISLSSPESMIASALH